MSPMPTPGPLSEQPLRIEICQDADDLARHAAGLIVAQAGRAFGSRRQFALALSGGQTPRLTYELLTQDHYAYQIVWPAVRIWFSDERCVPPDDARSNYRMVQETLLSRVPIPDDNVRRMRGEDDPQRAAADYEKQLDASFTGGPRFDLVLLGMGPDGHTASLFPGSDAVMVTGRSVVATRDPQGMSRLTLTLPAINAARAVAVLVSGQEKAAMLRRVLGAEARDEGLPIQKVKPAGQLIWMIDEAAASELSPPADAVR